MVRLPYHRHILTAHCTVCRVRQESQQDKFIRVIDAEDFDAVGGPTWRNDEALKGWYYDEETISWKYNAGPTDEGDNTNNEKVESNLINNENVQVSKNSASNTVYTDQMSPEDDICLVDSVGNNVLDFSVDSMESISE